MRRIWVLWTVRRWIWRVLQILLIAATCTVAPNSAAQRLAEIVVGQDGHRLAVLQLVEQEDEASYRH